MVIYERIFKKPYQQIKRRKTMDFNNLRFGLRGHDIAGNFKDMCRLAKAGGVPCLQFALAKTMADIDFDSVGYDEKLANEIKSELESFNLSVSVLGCYINPVDTNEEMRIKQLGRFESFLHYAKTLGAKMVGTETGNRSTIEETRSSENYELFLSGLIPLVREAERLGVTIGIEPVSIYTIYSVAMMNKLLCDVNSPALAVIFDLSNILDETSAPNQRQIISDAFSLFGDKIRAVHLKDFVFENGGKRFAVAGEGQYDIRFLFEQMEKLEKMPEIILDELPLSMYERAVKNIQRILENRG